MRANVKLFAAALSLLWSLLATASVDGRHAADADSRLRRELIAVTTVGDDCDKPATMTNAYGYGSRGRDDDDDSNDSNDDRKEKMMLGVSFAGVAALVAVALLWRACLECCKRSDRYAKHRAFAKRTDIGSWTCRVCFHSNAAAAQHECVLCGSPSRDIRIRVEQAAPSQDESARGGSSYLEVTTPRIPQSMNPQQLNDRQRVALERHAWKRCIGIRSVRWVSVTALDVRKHEKLRGAIVQEKRFVKCTRDAAAAGLGSSDESSAHGSASSLASESSSSGGDSSNVLTLSDGRAFVRDDRSASAVTWCPVDEFAQPARVYSKDLQRVASLRFADKTQWFYRQSLKLSSSLVDGFHTIRVHREHVLKQSSQIMLTAPTATLRRRLRVDFMEEPGIDGGGILREWLHVVCTELFSDALGLFELTDSSAHQGYWIRRGASKSTRSSLEMYQFFGKVLGKALLEGLVLNVRLAIPLLKHVLGVPFTLTDLRLLDETLHSSLRWILTHDNVEALSLTFAVDNVELVPNGAAIDVTDCNKRDFVDRALRFYLLDSVQDELAAVLDGLHSVLPATMLHVFDYKELDVVVSGLPLIDVHDWRAHTDVRLLGECVVKEVAVIEWFWSIVEGFSQDARGRLLQYVTGSSGVPVEGFQGLSGMDGSIQLFTIQLTAAISRVYTVLPHASTCLNRLDLPVYESRAELEEILRMIITMDVTGFNSR